MDGINEVSLKDITQLSDLQLTKLLHKLLELEAQAFKLEGLEYEVPFNITSGDGGEDGRVKWNGTPKETKWLKNKFTIFQNKATGLTPAACVEEILELKVKAQPRVLKSQIEILANACGCYVLFTNRAINKKGKEERIKRFREGFTLAGKANASTMQIIVYDANSIKDWVNDYISSVIQVHSDNGITRRPPFETWDDWATRIRAGETPFRSNDPISKKSVALLSGIEKAKVFRVTGHSGLGKTRFVLETFRSTPLKNQIIYHDLQGDDDIADLKAFIISHQQKRQGILVIDNCDVTTHIKLSELVKPVGNFKIITIGFEDSRSIEDLKIKFDKEEQRDIVKEIIVDILGTSYSQQDIEYINRVCEGYPWMAVRVCNTITEQGLATIHNIPVETFIKKLVFKSLKQGNDKDYNVIRGCSVFTAFGFNDDSFRDVINPNLAKVLKEQTQYIRTKVIDDPTVTETMFKTICQKFREDDILERRGRYYIVKPTILAVNLAAEWLLNTDADRIIEIIQELKNYGLQERFVERFKDLDQLDKAKQIVAELWGVNGPFSSAEVLNTNWGSLLFRHVVEVNPQECVNTLKRIYASFQPEEILKVEQGRRNLIWALEKLCFRNETFVEAAKILYLFAVGENETIGNNATGQFKQLFHVFLPGTEANLKSRIAVLEWGLSKSSEPFTQLAIDAISSGMVVDNFTRMGGAEKQGSGAPLKDYQPTNSDIREYWESLLALLAKISKSSSVHSEYAQEKMAAGIRNCARAGGFDLMVPILEEIITKKSGKWPSALSGLKLTKAFESNLPVQTKEKIDYLIELLSSKDIEYQLQVLISNPVWDFSTRAEEDHVDHQMIRAKKLAEEIVANKTDITPYLKNLLTGDQLQGYNFGRRLGELPVGKTLLRKCIDILLTVEPKSLNISLVGGLLAGINDRNLTGEVVDYFINHVGLRQRTIHLISLAGLDKLLFDKVILQIAKNNIPLEELRVFQYGGVIRNLSVNEFKESCERISEFGVLGKWIALSLIFMHSFYEKEQFKEFYSLAKKIITSDNLLTIKTSTYRIEGYQWSEIVGKLLRRKKDTMFAKKIASQIVEFCNTDNFSYSLDTYVRGTLNTLFEQYFKFVWPVIGKGILADHLGFFHLQNLIGAQNGTMNPHPGIAFNSEERYNAVYDWCLTQPLKAIERIAHMMPVNFNIDGVEDWHPFARRIIDNFGQHKSVLKSIITNLGSYGTVGSRVPYFEMQKILFSKIRRHKIPEVAEWAEEHFKIMEREIKSELLSDEEDFI